MKMEGKETDESKRKWKQERKKNVKGEQEGKSVAVRRCFH